MRWFWAAAAVIAVAAASAWALHRPAQAEVGGNRTPPGSFVVTLGPGQRVCDGVGVSAHPSRALRATIGLQPTEAPQPLQATIDGRPGPVLRGYRGGVVDLPIAAAPKPTGATGCLRNLGRRSVLVAGIAGGQATLDGRRRDVAVSYGLVDPHPPRWNTRRGLIWHRVGAATGAPLGRLTGVAVVLLFVAAMAGAVASMMRWAR